MLFVRSILFNIAFFIWMAVACVGLAWTVLLPREALMRVVRWFLWSVAWLERNVAGIEFEVIGREKLPAEGTYIVAAKHQSAWETMKMPIILRDPAVVLKRELTKVPVWGVLARKSRMIPVDREAGVRAIATLLEGAMAIKAEGRPIAIFPQGTRVAPGKRAPYKAGVGLIYKKLNVPMVPMALNSGVFWPRRAFFKRPGKITVEFLDPIPAGLSRNEAMARLETVLEAASDRLVRRAGGPALEPPSAVAEPETRAGGV